MSKLNTKTKKKPVVLKKGSGVPVEIGISFNGNVQYVKDGAQQLYEIAVSSLYGKDTYYESSDVRLGRLISAVNSTVKEGLVDYVANVIVHARGPMKIRSMPILLTVYFAKALRDHNIIYPKLRQVVRDVIQRADQITDIYAVALSVFGSKKAIPMSIKRGVGDAFNKFNEYQFAKYFRSADVKLNDVLRIVHPVAVDSLQGNIFEKIRDDALSTPYTWETELSANGSLPKDKQKSKQFLWTELVMSGKVGYMALLRNLRNIVEADVSAETIDTVAATLSDPGRVAKSKQFPFSFVKALQALSPDVISSSRHSSWGRQVTASTHGNARSLSKISDAITEAIEHSLGNLPKIGENVWLIVDCSGSMQGEPMDTACMLGAAISKSSRTCSNFAMTMFSDGAKMVRVRRSDSVMTIYEAMIKQNEGGGTNLEAALRMKDKIGFEPDTVILVSDMQVDQLSTRTDPLKMFGKNVVKVAINMSAYATTPVHEVGGWMQLSGFSEKMFDLIPALRNKETIVSTLNVPYEPTGYRLPFRDDKQVAGDDTVAEKAA